MRPWNMEKEKLACLQLRCVWLWPDWLKVQSSLWSKLGNITYWDYRFQNSSVTRYMSTKLLRAEVQKNSKNHFFSGWETHHHSIHISLYPLFTPLLFLSWVYFWAFNFKETCGWSVEFPVASRNGVSQLGDCNKGDLDEVLGPAEGSSNCRCCEDFANKSSFLEPKWLSRAEPS